MTSPDPSAATDQPSAGRNRLVLIVYTAAIFVSALLLFSVQPLFTKMVLPRLGGSPAVWSVAMVFFQSLLLAGYAYAHYLMQLRNRMIPVAIHLVLLVIALLSLPLSIASGWGEPPTSGYAFWLLGLFAVSIGLPFFALAANNPLLQAWFVRTGHPNGPDPYFLYASSNIGSFLALLSYPVLLEPMFTLRTQNLIWTGGYGLLIVLIAACGVLLLRSPATAAVDALAEDTDAPAPPWILRARWIFLAAVPSGLLIAVTAHISTDVAAAPLLWVLPLSLYLLTWVLVFQSRPLLPHKWMLMLQPLAIAGVIVLLAIGGEQNLLLTLGGHLLCFFVIAMACHGELARTRPAAKYLTGFYVALSFGGMVGGLFAGLIAPFAFSWIAEYPILLALAALCRPPGGDERLPRWSRWYWPFLAVLAVALIAPSWSDGKIDVDWLDDQTGLGDRRGRRALGAAGARAERQPLEDLCHRRAGAGADPGLSGRRRAGGNRAQLFRRPQDRGDAARPVSRADARHHDSRRAEIPERRRHAGHRAARADHLLPQGRRHRPGDHGDPRAQGRAAARRGDRARRRHAGLRLRAGRDLEILRDRSDPWSIPRAIPNTSPISRIASRI